MAAAGRSAALEVYNWEPQKEKLMELYSELAER